MCWPEVPRPGRTLAPGRIERGVSSELRPQLGLGGAGELFSEPHPTPVHDVGPVCEAGSGGSSPVTCPLHLQFWGAYPWHLPPLGCQAHLCVPTAVASVPSAPYQPFPEEEIVGRQPRPAFGNLDADRGPRAASPTYTPPQGGLRPALQRAAPSLLAQWPVGGPGAPPSSFGPRDLWGEVSRKRAGGRDRDTERHKCRDRVRQTPGEEANSETRTGRRGDRTDGQAGDDTPGTEGPKGCAGLAADRPCPEVL